MDFLSQAFQLILSLSILVALHEAGHYFPAKWFKVRVEKFFLFFDVPFGPKDKRTWDGALVKKKRGETLFGVGWIPFGGYVKLGGMIDESNDTNWDHIPENEQFRFKPAWQRLIIMIGGVVVNLILGFLIYMMVMGTWGEEKLPISSATDGMAFSSILERHGLEDGDVITGLNGESIEFYDEINRRLLLDNIHSIEFERNGISNQATISGDLGQMLLDSGVRAAVSIRVPSVIAEFGEKSAIRDAGVPKGSTITAVDGVATPFFSDFKNRISVFKDTMVNIGYVDSLGRKNSALVKADKESRLGFRPTGPLDLLETQTFKYGVAESFSAGWNLGKSTLLNYIVSLKFMASSSGWKQMGSVGTIGKLFNPGWDWEQFWKNTAFLSLILAFMNILPIPALDGGHVLFLIYEIIRGKPLPQRFMETAQMIGMLLLLTLMLYALGMDVIRAIF